MMSIGINMMSIYQNETGGNRMPQGGFSVLRERMRTKEEPPSL